MALLGIEEGLKSRVHDFYQLCVDGHEVVTCRHLLEKDVPQYVKSSFISFARRRLKELSPITWNYKKAFDFNDPELKDSIEQLTNVLQMNIHFTKKDVELCINNAVKIRFEFILRPQKAIEAFFINKKNQIDKEIIIRSIEKFGSNIPFMEKLGEKLEKYPQKTLDYDQYLFFSREIKKELYSNVHKELFKEFDLLLDMSYVNGKVGPKALEFHLVEEFLGCRGLENIQNLVHNKVEKGKEVWYKQDIIDLISLVFNIPSSKISQQSLAKENVYPKIIFSDDKFLKIQRQKIEHQPPGPYPSIYDYIDRKDWKIFVRKLFKKDEKEFKNFINRIDKITKWRDAKQIIDWELEKRQVDFYSREAVRLGDVIFAKYFSKGVYV